jgi:hypothetical protein
LRPAFLAELLARRKQEIRGASISADRLLSDLFHLDRQSPHERVEAGVMPPYHGGRGMAKYFCYL